MPVLATRYDELCRLIGRKIPREDLVGRVPMMGGAYDGEDAEGNLLFEFFPNRPDLLSVEGLARACRAFFDVKPGLARYESLPSGTHVTIDKTVTKIRPYLGFAFVRGLHFDESLLTGLIEVQERLTTGPGRRRKRVAVGIHDAAPVQGPFTYRAVKTDEVRFVPLGMSQALTPKEILEQHEKGRLFGDLVRDLPRVPLIEDKDGQVLSLPPIINGELTALTTRTRDVIVDVTGTDARAVATVLNICATLLAERGGRIESLELVQGARRSRTPDLDPQALKLPHKRVQALLGIGLDPAGVRHALGRMGHDAEAQGAQASLVHSPAYRMDILHADDLVEDVGIGYGFERFEPRLPEAPQFASLRPATRLGDRARTLLLGMGFTEVVTLTVTGRRDAFTNLGARAGPVVEVENPITLDQSILRSQLLPSLLGILRANKHRELPQNIFEVGVAVPYAPGGAPRNELRACAVRLASRATLADCKSLVEAFLRDAAIPATLVPAEPAGFIPGRAGLVQRDAAPIGFFGELHPQTLVNFELGAPAIAFEIAL